MQVLISPLPNQAPDFIFHDPSFDPLDPAGRVPVHLVEQIKACLVSWSPHKGALVQLVKLLLQVSCE